MKVIQKLKCQRVSVFQKNRHALLDGVKLFMLISWSPLSSQAAPVIPPFNPAELQPGGATTTAVKSSLLNPLANLSLVRQEQFYIGRSFYRSPWVQAPSITTDRDGLGPLFNMRSCVACHANGGRGLPPLSDGVAMNSMLFRLSIPEPGEHGALKPEPLYGDQLQALGISLTYNKGMAESGSRAQQRILGEAQVHVTYTPQSGHYADGSSWELLSPDYRITALSYGAMREDVLLSPRVAQQQVGLGLLAAIPERDIVQGADSEDVNQDGISGRPNWVWDVQQQKIVLGRFGHKANQPTILQQSAAAFRGDLGITNRLFPEENCMPDQHCEAAPSGADPKTGVEIPDKFLTAVDFFVKALGVPTRRKPQDAQVQQGRNLFYQSGCPACHTPSFTTGDDADLPELNQQTIWPYTDLLLHDMGAGLADQRPDFAATGQEWRTPPLWAIGLMKRTTGAVRYLHDGRARSIAEAILWHGGEGKTARTAFMQLSADEREALVAFVKDL